MISENTFNEIRSVAVQIEAEIEQIKAVEAEIAKRKAAVANRYRLLLQAEDNLKQVNDA